MSTDVLSAITTQTNLRQLMKPRSFDMTMLAIVACLAGIGVVMLYSASAVMAAQKLGDHLYLVRTQSIRIGLGVMLLMGALSLDYRWYKRLVYPILGFAFTLLTLVLVPGIGKVQNGARRWFSVAGLSFQPSEVVKIAAIIYLAYSISKKAEKMKRFSVGFIPHILVIGAMVALLMKQPDFGTSVILLTMMMGMLFVSGAKIFYLGAFGILGVFGAFLAISGSDYRLKRWLAYVDPWAYQQDIGYQITESFIAIGSGGLGGVGLGAGHGKLGYVPELWNDFIGTIIAEELGIFGIIVVVALFIGFLWRGVRIAFRCDDPFGMYLAFGITALFGLQASANLCVVTGLLPNKGLTLPFVSFGGSSMMMGLFAVGILLNISKNNPDTWEEGREERSLKKSDRKWEKKRRDIISRRDDLASKYN